MKAILPGTDVRITGSRTGATQGTLQSATATGAPLELTVAARHAAVNGQSDYGVIDGVWYTPDDVPGKPGAYRAVAFLRPHFQLDELSISLRLVADLPASARK